MSFYYNSRTSNESIKDVCSSILGVNSVELVVKSIRYHHRFSDYCSAIKLILEVNNPEQRLELGKDLEFMILGRENYTPFFVELGVKEYYEAAKKRIIGVIDSMERILGASPQL